MTKLLIKLFIPDKGDPRDSAVRQRYGTMAGGTGIALNLLLFLGKLLAGILTGSVAVAADAVNNLSDAASSVMPTWDGADSPPPRSQLLRCCKGLSCCFNL